MIDNQKKLHEIFFKIYVVAHNQILQWLKVSLGFDDLVPYVSRLWHASVVIMSELMFPLHEFVFAQFILSPERGLSFKCYRQSKHVSIYKVQSI